MTTPSSVSPVSTPLRYLATCCVHAYQRHLSPHKGYCCSYSYRTGRASCSAHCVRLLERFGLIDTLLLMRRRFKACQNAYAMNREDERLGRKPPRWTDDKLFCDPCLVGGTAAALGANAASSARNDRICGDDGCGCK
ncbi:MAG: membrane protein insertion efficiency factor YidD [Verrucomicrobiaceae bacterium]|nr:membrane protein insertion efficiency factor YidD [Verrucomicrobiaceae bacterium]